ncbi:MAG: hypothetical protein A2W93_12140 [Bacteroidetes bacterium GWF2_43_63]|nr:MAG: hypothetical protein A2W94_15630 [Bacteroidetes bacterium GWE2_42_42]OFY56372.1 MAG: hypothetical protein A2W93_12140 [Bacteroidetes bacterium GWF2_43_63]HBG69662.1 hypothetical protein [Bacteroidales bacterium]HCB61929.1 hypothetical protein [Bacteroidales bacterium]HCY42292.1 hypothetical protein [Prolixibacteraceae bacterium]
MDQYLLSYINQQMLERGYKKYRFESLSILTKDDEVEYLYPAYNEYLFLVSKELANNTVICADNNVYTVNQHYKLQVFAQIREFTGQIKITNPANTVQLIEFIRVIPK